jgi:hypothetical protein
MSIFAKASSILTGPKMRAALGSATARQVMISGAIGGGVGALADGNNRAAGFIGGAALGAGGMGAWRRFGGRLGVKSGAAANPLGAVQRNRVGSMAATGMRDPDFSHSAAAFMLGRSNVSRARRVGIHRANMQSRFLRMKHGGGLGGSTGFGAFYQRTGGI